MRLQFADLLFQPPLDAEHQPSHRQLIETLACPMGSTELEGLVELIAMPTSRPFAKTLPAIELALELAHRAGAVLILLCSRAARIEDFPVDLLRRWPVRVVLVPTPADPSGDDLLPAFRTSAHAFAAKEWTWPRDVAGKRNLALLLAISLGRRHLLFLDDDVRRPASDHAAEHLVFGAESVANAFQCIRAGQYPLVGWTMEEFPDNSAMCHARRLLGLEQTSFIGGGSLGLYVTDEVPFFPSIYNEDWLFLYPYLVAHQRGGKPVGSAGIIHQARYNPFATGRARSEEMGDVLAEGLLGALDPSIGRRAARQAEYWRVALERRSEMIDELGAMADDPKIVRDRQLTVRHVAEIRDALISVVKMRAAADEKLGDLGSVYVDFLQKWRRDQQRWRDHVGRVSSTTAEEILEVRGARLLGCSRAEDLRLAGDDDDAGCATTPALRLPDRAMAVAGSPS